MKRNYITKQMLSIIIKSKDYFPSNKLFLSVFLILKFLGIAILLNIIYLQQLLHIIFYRISHTTLPSLEINSIIYLMQLLV